MVKKFIFRWASRLILQPWFRLTRGGTLGVRCLVHDQQNRVLLVRHSYAPGWLFPGGGVERGETAQVALHRELQEEAAVTFSATAPQLFGLYANHAHFSGDHIAFYVVSNWQRDAWKPGVEIVEAGFFERTDLPKGTTPGTKRRIAEVFDNREPDNVW